MKKQKPKKTDTRVKQVSANGSPRADKNSKSTPNGTEQQAKGQINPKIQNKSPATPAAIEEIKLRADFKLRFAMLVIVAILVTGGIILTGYNAEEGLKIWAPITPLVLALIPFLGRKVNARE